MPTGKAPGDNVPSSVYAGSIPATVSLFKNVRVNMFGSLNLFWGIPIYLLTTPNLEIAFDLQAIPEAPVTGGNPPEQKPSRYG